MNNYRIGVDIGGTFTDFCLFDQQDKVARTHKRLTTPNDPSEAVMDGIMSLLAEGGLSPSDIQSIVHGTTLVTNAVIERRGVSTAMLVTEGFSDVLNIGHERRYDLFDLTIQYPEPVVPRPMRIEVPGRLRSDGGEVAPLNLEGLEEKVRALVERHNVEAIAVCLLHSYANGSHEASLVRWLNDRFPELSVSSSSEVFPFMREFERWTTTCLNAYVQPVVSRYLDRLESGLTKVGFAGSFFIMSSSGGTLTSAMARRFPIRLLESGPAAGALMSAFHGQKLSLPNLLSFDMGGTTAKGCIVKDGVPLKSYELEVARVHEFRKGSGLPVKIPVLDMIEIGAGGGSIASIDDRGVIKVGPRSAGAKPGPASYGRGGTAATLTDANLVLGYLGAASFLGGNMQLNTEAAVEAIDRNLATPLGMEVIQAAWGIHEVINEDVARAFRVHASERGIDYRRCSMVVFGGSGPLHGASIARKLRVPRVVCPVGAGVMSAFGLLASPNSFEIVRSRRVAMRDLDQSDFEAMLRSVQDEVDVVMQESSIPPSDIAYKFWLDMRYEGQGYEVEVPLANWGLEDAHDAFGKEYSRVFGLSFPERAVEIASWKVEARGPVPALGESFELRRKSQPRQHAASRPMWVSSVGKLVDCPVYNRYSLNAGDIVNGPALIEEAESTCVIHDGDCLTVDQHLNLVIEIGAK